MGSFFVILALGMSFVWLGRQGQNPEFLSGIVIGNIYFALVPMTLTLVLGEIVAEGLPIEPFRSASVSVGAYVLLFTAAILGAASISVPKHIKTLNNEPTKGEFLFVFAVSLMMLIIVFFNSGKLSGSHWAAHHEGGFIGSVVAVVSLSLRAYLYALATALFRHHLRTTLFVALIYTVLDIVLTGNRISVLYLILAMYFSGGFSKFAWTLMCVVLSPAVLFLSSLYPAFRGVVWSQFGGFSGFLDALYYVSDVNFSPKYAISIVYNLFEASNVAVFQYIFREFGKLHPFIYGETVLVKPLTFFIPREIWDDKPLGLGTRIGNDIFGIDGLSLNSLMYGEFYANFGWFAPLVAFVLLVVLATVLRGSGMYRDPRHRLALFILGFSAWRHEFNYIVFSFASLLVVIYLSRWLFRVKFKLRRRAKMTNFHHELPCIQCYDDRHAGAKRE